MASSETETEGVAVETRTDTERLAWLVEHDASFGRSGRMEEPLVIHDDGSVTGGSEWTETIFARVPCLHLYEWHCYDGPTWRDALDAAMDAPPCRESKKHGCANSRTIRAPEHDHPSREREAQLTARIRELEAARSSEGQPMSVSSEREQEEDAIDAARWRWIRPFLEMDGDVDGADYASRHYNWLRVKDEHIPLPEGWEWPSLEAAVDAALSEG